MHSKKVLAALVVCLLAPTATAQLSNPNESTDTTLYFHIFDTLNRFVINTQPMNTEYFEVGGSNFPTITGTPVNTLYGVEWDFNTIYGTSTAGPVEYKITENGKPRFHPERGIAADVVLDQGVQPVVYLYVEVRDFTGLDFAPNALPTFTFDVNVREGDDPGKDADLDQGTLIMSGSETYNLCAGNEVGASGLPIEDVCAALPLTDPTLFPDENGIIEVAIPLTIQQGTIPKSEAFNVRLDWYQFAEYGAEPDQFAEGYMRFHASDAYQPHMKLNIMNPVYVEFLHPQVAAGTLLIHSGVNSPWGTYDVDVNNMTVSVTGPSTPGELKRVVSQNAHVHGLHDKAAEITYLWKFRDEKAANGDYVIDISVPNVAGTSTATARAGFTVEGAKAFGTDTEGNEVTGTEGETEDTPGIGLLVSLGTLGLLGLALRRKF
ncbi:MAG: hypothetical protein ACPHK8_02240 [Thermoplasmatota archaeon]